MGHAFRPVLLHHVVDHLAAAIIGEVDVDVRHRDARRVQEALEDQAVAERIERGDVKRIGDDAARGRSTPRSNENPPLLGEPNEIPHHKEVVGEAHRADDAELISETLADLAIGVTVFAANSFTAEVLEVLIGGHPLGHREVRQVVPLEPEVELAHLRDADGVGDRVRNLSEKLRHLLRALEEELVALHAHPLGIAEGGVGLDADEQFLRRGVSLLAVMDVVGGDERQVE